MHEQYFGISVDAVSRLSIYDLSEIRVSSEGHCAGSTDQFPGSKSKFVLPVTSDADASTSKPFQMSRPAR